MSYEDVYFRSKFPSKIVRKKPPVKYKKLTGVWNCYNCWHPTASAVQMQVGGAPRVACPTCVPIMESYT